MEDKIIIKSKRYDVKKLLNYALILGVIAFIVLFFVLSLPEISSAIKSYDWCYAEVYVEDGRNLTSRVYDHSKELVDSYDNGFEYAMSGFFAIDSNFTESFWFDFLCGFCGPLVLACIPYFLLKSYELVITDKRAYGTTIFGKRVDLPMDSITAVSFGWFKGITISTASGRISFLLIKNRDKMYETINKLILERQSKQKQGETIVKQEIPQSNADELKKFKDLLDSGVITQEEFDAKKKQLLGL